MPFLKSFLIVRIWWAIVPLIHLSRGIREKSLPLLSSLSFSLLKTLCFSSISCGLQLSSIVCNFVIEPTVLLLVCTHEAAGMRRVELLMGLAERHFESENEDGLIWSSLDSKFRSCRGAPFIFQKKMRKKSLREDESKIKHNLRL